VPLTLAITGLYEQGKPDSSANLPSVPLRAATRATARHALRAGPRPPQVPVLGPEAAAATRERR
jgi:hypothetical protein